MKDKIDLSLGVAVGSSIVSSDNQPLGHLTDSLMVDLANCPLRHPVSAACNIELPVVRLTLTFEGSP